jgi:hypothetical protein
MAPGPHTPDFQCRPEDAPPIRTPQTDPTNPYRQEAVGHFVRAELSPERSLGVQPPPVSEDIPEAECPA